MLVTLKHTQTLILAVIFALLAPLVSLAATMSMSPATGVYSAGTTFSARVIVNSAGKSINAAEGTIKFNPQEVTVVSIDRSNSIFSLWVTEPSFSNSAGTVTFSGGLPTGYTGSSGTVFNITFRTTNAGTARVSLTNGAVLANDGMGTNVLTAMNGGTYTIQAPSTSPTPEVVEYVAPANTPGAPQIESSTHGDFDAWYKSKTAVLSWTLPSGVTSVRTLLDESQSSVPTRVYETPISTITLNDLPEGESYFHLQFRNEDGWGKVSHYRLGVDTESPSDFNLALPEGADLSNPKQTLIVQIKDEASGVSRYQIKVDNEEAYEFIDEKNEKKIVLSELSPGLHSIIVEAFDKAGNSTVSSFTLTLSAFDRPTFTEYPNEINEEVIPVVRGLTRPRAQVEVSVQKIGAEPTLYNLTSDDSGVFTLIPEGTFTQGVYELKARAIDEFGAQSETSETIRIAVQQPGYVQVGTFLINILSVVIPLLAMLVLLGLSVWFLVAYMRRFKGRVSRESKEALMILAREFEHLNEVLSQEQERLTQAKKTKKLSKTEEEMFVSLVSALKSAQTRVEKEVDDVEQLV